MKWIKAHLPTQRRLIQLYVALLYNAHIKGFITGNIYTGNSKILCVCRASTAIPVPGR